MLLTPLLRSAMHVLARHGVQGAWGGLAAPGPASQRLAGWGWQSRSLKTATAGARGRPRSRGPASAAALPANLPNLNAGADVGVAIEAACASLGRTTGPAEAELVQRLQDNWFQTAADLAGISDADAASLRLPLRLRSQVALLLQAAAAQAAEPLAGAADAGRGPSSGLLPPIAEQVASGYPSAEQAPGAAPAGSPAASNGSSSSGSDGGAGGGQGAGGGTGAGSSAGDATSSELLGASVEAAIDHGLDGVPIEERRCPPVRRAQFRSTLAPKLHNKGRAQPYALKEEDLCEALQQEFAAFDRFLTKRFFGAQGDPIAPVTAAKYAAHMRQFLGWLHREQGHPLGTLSFSAALPSAGREGVTLAFDYLQWLTGERGVSVRTERMALRAIQSAAKFLYHDQSKVRLGSGDKPYSDLEIVKELRLMDSTARRLEKVAPRASDESLKWLDWPEYLRVVQELRRECAGKDENGRLRSPTAVAWSLQRYLIFAILSCVPDRQRTLRELEVGRTLFQERARWVIRHGPGDYKTGKTYGERPPLVIAPHIYPELEAFIDKWRAALQPQHNYLFTQQSGAPLTEQSVYRLFSTTAYRLTGKKCNPHLVRDSIVTYLRGAGASERDLEALALYMGHSVEMQRDTYDRRTKSQKVEPAVELLASLNAAALRGQAGA